MYLHGRAACCVNVNTTDATAGATALLLPAQNTHTLHDPKRDTEHARAGGFEVACIHMKSFMFFIGVLTASFFGPPRGLVLATQQQNFATISGTGVVVSVYARRPQAEMVVVGNAAMRQSGD